MKQKYGTWKYCVEIIHTLNNLGPRTEPWAHPIGMLNMELKALLNCTYPDRSLRKLKITLTK